jgi:hypothetical protein
LHIALGREKVGEFLKEFPGHFLADHLQFD